MRNPLAGAFRALRNFNFRLWTAGGLVSNIGTWMQLIGLAVLALGYLAYRTIWRGNEFEGLVPKDIPISAKEWTIWLSEARTAAARGEWRDAIHLAYWAGISFLERQGMWKPDRARTQIGRA